MVNFKEWKISIENKSFKEENSNESQLLNVLKKLYTLQ